MFYQNLKQLSRTGKYWTIPTVFTEAKKGKGKKLSVTIKGHGCQRLEGNQILSVHVLRVLDRTAEGER